MFCHENDSMDFYSNYKERALKFAEDLGLKADHLRFHDHDRLCTLCKSGL